MHRKNIPEFTFGMKTMIDDDNEEKIIIKFLFSLQSNMRDLQRKMLKRLSLSCEYAYNPDTNSKHKILIDLIDHEKMTKGNLTS